MTKNSKPSIRFATENDVELIIDFIKIIAKAQKIEDQMATNIDDLKYWMFERKLIEVIFCMLDGKEIGYVIFFHNFSSFLGKCGIFIEDICVLPEYRGQGYGSFLFKAIAKIAKERKCGRIEFECLKDNTTAREFYEAHGADCLNDWKVYRCDTPTIAKLAESE
ncbi:MAG: GNAT family N-acetyltransferase [Coriobacteriales bacterium]|nr:GNAT family N-acetyltransferase [Coriobacteriales bacterium]